MVKYYTLAFCMQNADSITQTIEQEGNVSNGAKIVIGNLKSWPDRIANKPGEEGHPNFATKLYLNQFRYKDR